MISHIHKTIFIHIPKVAGQSMELFFLNLINLDWDSRSPLLLRPNDNAKIGPPRLAHLKAHEYYKYNYISKDIFDDYFKFSFVRNPWSRVLSFYKFFNYNQIISFNTFVQKELPRLFEKDYWFVGPQFEYICDENKDLLIDFLGKYENMKSDFAEVCHILNIHDSELPYKNKSINKKGLQNLKNILITLKRNPSLLKQVQLKDHAYNTYRDCYDSVSKKIVNKLYECDIDLFEYSY